MRARWHKEDTGRGTYAIVVTEIPWLVQKARLIETLAELINDKKLPLVADVRDEIARGHPRRDRAELAHGRSQLLMESLFKLTELESRIPLNMNVLVKGPHAQGDRPRRGLREWLDHRREVLLRRSRHRLAEIEQRLEVLGGYLVAYLNLDKVIKIIRNEDEPKPVLMKTFKLTDVQADAILNMRLRNLRKLEEMEIKRENKDLREEKAEIEKLLGSEAAQWKTVAGEIKEVRKTFGPKTPLGKRRTAFADAPEHDEAAIEEAMVEREPITVVVSEKGWIRALRGTSPISPASPSRPTTSRSSRSSPRPPPRSWCSPPTGASTRSRRRSCRAGAATASRSAVHRYRAGGPSSSRRSALGRAQVPGRQRAGRGFVVPEDECLANTRKGKQVLNVDPPDEARRRGGRGRPRRHDRREPQDAVFPLEQVPEMARKGVRGCSATRTAACPTSKVFAIKDGLTWKDSSRPHLDGREGGPPRLDRQPRRGRPPAAEGLSQEQPLQARALIQGGASGEPGTHSWLLPMSWPGFVPPSHQKRDALGRLDHWKPDDTVECVRVSLSAPRRRLLCVTE